MPAPSTPRAWPRTTPRLFVHLVVAACGVALIPTIWTSVDLDLAALFVGDTPTLPARDWWWVMFINAYVPSIFRWGVFTALGLWLVASLLPRISHWRMPLAYIVLAGALGPGLVVNLGFKDHWQRSRPYQVEQFGGTQKFTRAAVITDQCNNNCSFVSGHVACGVFMASLMLLQPRRKKTWLLVGVVCGLAVGFSRMAAAAHWFSDVMWAFPITLTTCWLVWRSVLWFYTRKPSPTVA